MRIGFDAKRLFNNFTGLGNYSRFIVNALKANYPEHAYVLFTPRHRDHPETRVFLDVENFETVTPPGWVTTLKGGSIWRSFGIGADVKTKRIDVYHGLSHELPYNLSTSVRSIVTVHDLIFLRFPQFYNPIDRTIYKSKVRHACNVANRIVAISEQTRQDLIEFLSIDENKIDVVYQGVHPIFEAEITADQVDHVRAIYNLPSEYLLNVGSIEPRKNLLTLVKALSRLKRDTALPLVVIGRPTHYLDEINAFVERAQMHDRVIFLHSVKFQDLPAIYHGANTFIYPSLFEGFGIPLIEAIQCNTPVITSTGSCFSEAAGPDSIYVNPKNDEELAHAIERVVGDSTLRASMITKSRNYIERFKPHVIARDMMSLYSGL